MLIVDDSLYERKRSKKVELLARVHDHNRRLYTTGFRMLTLGWSDGFSFAPLEFMLLSSKNKRNRLREARQDVHPASNDAKRRREAVMKATDLLPGMVQRAIQYGVKARYLLCDSWFTSRALVHQLSGLIDVVGMVKRNRNYKYELNGDSLDVRAIYKRIKKNRGKSPIRASVVVGIGYGKTVKLVFIKWKKSKEWRVILCSNPILLDEEIIRLYGIRWDIEVFFKIIKQFLRLQKEVYARNYDSLVAHTTIVFVRYLFLVYRQRIKEDDRTLGVLFRDLAEEVHDISLTESLSRIAAFIINVTHQIVKEHVANQDIVGTIIDELVERIIGSLPKLSAILKEQG